MLDLLKVNSFFSFLQYSHSKFSIILICTFINRNRSFKPPKYICRHIVKNVDHYRGTHSLCASTCLPFLPFQPKILSDTVCDIFTYLDKVKISYTVSDNFFGRNGRNRRNRRNRRNDSKYKY